MDAGDVGERPASAELVTTRPSPATAAAEQLDAGPARPTSSAIEAATVEQLGGAWPSPATTWPAPIAGEVAPPDALRPWLFAPDFQQRFDRPEVVTGQDQAGPRCTRVHRLPAGKAAPKAAERLAALRRAEERVEPRRHVLPTADGAGEGSSPVGSVPSWHVTDIRIAGYL